MPTSRETGSETDREVGGSQGLQLNKTDTCALKDLLQQRLNDCGWRQSIREIIRNTLESKGIENVTYDQLAAEIIPQARALVPAEVRKELYQRVLQSLEP
ncbi:hypothetical protein KR222_004803, partial [Zaprionus bogoriensis]